MSRASIDGVRIAGIATSVPGRVIDNLEADLGFAPEHVRKVVAMTGVERRHVAAPGQTSADLCADAASRLLEALQWPLASIDALLFVTQTPDHFVPANASVVHGWLGLSEQCAAFDVGLGCSGYPYGLYLAAAMLGGGGHRRVLLLHGETTSRVVDPADAATALLFGDAGSATAIEASPGAPRSHFVLHSDGGARESLIVRDGAFRERRPGDVPRCSLVMDGEAIFAFALRRMPALLTEACEASGHGVGDIDHFVFHQSNRFVIERLARKCGLPADRVPLTLADTGNCGGPSVPVTITRRVPPGRDQRLMLLGYGAGLSWAAAVVHLDASVVLRHGESDRRWTTQVRP